MGTLNRYAGVAAATLLVAVAAFWVWDRFRPRPEPVFEPSRFVVMTPPVAQTDERWLVAVNPSCPHCRQHLHALEADMAGQTGHARLGALIVDTAARPDTLTLDALAPAGVWWDSAGIWRREWDHRTYGELLQFTSDGTLRATQPPGWRP